MSSQIWAQHCSNLKDSKIIEELILRDMEPHLLKAKDLKEFSKKPQIAINLMLTALAEVHANSQLFGGQDSVSFKIKWKQIDQRGRALCKMLYSKDK